MNRPRLIRGLRIAWSVWWGILCVLMIGLWVRSYRHWDELDYETPSHWSLDIKSNYGTLLVLHTPAQPGTMAGDGDWMFINMGAVESDQGFYWEFFPGLRQLLFPIWLPVAVSLVATVVPWIRASRRFSLRTLLIATTLIAVVLGLVVIMRH